MGDQQNLVSGWLWTNGKGIVKGGAHGIVGVAFTAVENAGERMAS